MVLASLLLLSLTANAILLFRFVYTTDSAKRILLMNLSVAGLATAFVCSDSRPSSAA